jgi:SRSO17 transposase
VANHFASLPVACRLYLGKEWAEDQGRRKKAGVPKDIRFQTKQQIALELIQRACEAGVARGTLLMDLDYGRDSKLRAGITALGLTYVAAVQPRMLVWPPGSDAKRRDKPLKTGRRDQPDLISAKELALRLPSRAWRKVTWREGSSGRLSSRFARVRVRVGYYQAIPETLAEEWLLIEWPKGEAEPTKYWLSTLPADISFRRLVDIAKLRWRIERDYQELKQEVGLTHYEGRGWRGFHHHVTLSIAAYGFLVAERAAFPPSAHRKIALRQETPLHAGYRPRGSALAA